LSVLREPVLPQAAFGECANIRFRGEDRFPNVLRKPGPGRIEFVAPNAQRPRVQSRTAEFPGESDEGIIAFAGDRFENRRNYRVNLLATGHPFVCAT
jgi:hypothetical protein